MKNFFNERSEADMGHWIHGNEPVEDRLNIERELDIFRDDPLAPFLAKLGHHESPLLEIDEVGRYQIAYQNYFLSLERFIYEMSIAIRWDNSTKYAWRIRQKYSPWDKRVAKKYHGVKRFIELDFINCLIHTRILCDRVVSLSRQFLDLNDKPSFTSFYDHKRFFSNGERSFGRHEEYADYFRKNTQWFDMPLKPVRDKFVFHAGPVHMRFLGYNTREDLTMGVIVPRRPSSATPKHDFVRISVRRLARDLKGFLEWFSAYGQRFIP